MHAHRLVPLLSRKPPPDPTFKSSWPSQLPPPCPPALQTAVSLGSWGSGHPHSHPLAHCPIPALTPGGPSRPFSPDTSSCPLGSEGIRPSGSNHSGLPAALVSCLCQPRGHAAPAPAHGPPGQLCAEPLCVAPAALSALYTFQGGDTLPVPGGEARPTWAVPGHGSQRNPSCSHLQPLNLHQDSECDGAEEAMWGL